MIVTPFFEFIKQQGVLILDGALATELERLGADLNDPLWSAKILLEAPEMIRQVHYDYFVAGADLAITSSYQISFEGFARRGLSREQTEAALRLSVKLAEEARDRFWTEPALRRERLRPLIAASIGPYGAFLADGSEYTGDYGLDEEELACWHRRRMAVLSQTNADLLACETIPCLTEAKAIIRLLAEFPATPAWLSFSCRDGARLSSGEWFAEAIELADQCPQVVAAGINCTAPEFVEPLLSIASRITKKDLIAYPNRGETWDAARKCWVEGGHSADLASLALHWRTAGARLIGGCCRTTPADISRIRRKILKISVAE